MQKKKTTINAFGKSVDISGVEPLATTVGAIGKIRDSKFYQPPPKDIKGLAKRSEKTLKFPEGRAQAAYDQRKDQAMMAKSKGPIRQGPLSRMKKINPRKEYSE